MDRAIERWDRKEVWPKERKRDTENGSRLRNEKNGKAVGGGGSQSPPESLNPPLKNTIDRETVAVIVVRGCRARKLPEDKANTVLDLA